MSCLLDVDPYNDLPSYLIPVNPARDGPIADCFKAALTLVLFPVSSEWFMAVLAD